MDFGEGRDSACHNCSDGLWRTEEREAEVNEGARAEGYSRSPGETSWEFKPGGGSSDGESSSNLQAIWAVFVLAVEVGAKEREIKENSQDVCFRICVVDGDTC